MNKNASRAALLSMLAAIGAAVLPPSADVRYIEPRPERKPGLPSRSREEARRRRQIARGILAVTALLTSGCAPLVGPGAAEASAAVVMAYPGAVRGCLAVRAAPARETCVEAAREAFGVAVEVFDASIDAALEAPAAREGTVSR